MLSFCYRDLCVAAQSIAVPGSGACLGVNLENNFLPLAITSSRYVLHCEIPYVSLIAATRQHQLSDIVKFSLLSNWGYDLGIKVIIPQPRQVIQISNNTVYIQL